MPPCWGHVWGMGTAEITRSNFEDDFFSIFFGRRLARTSDFDFGRSASARLVYSDPKLFAGPISSTGSTADRLGLASGATSVRAAAISDVQAVPLGGSAAHPSQTPPQPR